MASLAKLTARLESKVNVLRDGVGGQLPTRELVPGDIVLLTGGVQVPADIEWLDGDVLQVDTPSIFLSPSIPIIPLSPLSHPHTFPLNPLPSSHLSTPPHTHTFTVPQVDTAALTGENLPRKYPGSYGALIDAGTTIRAGEAYGVVRNTGLHTETGKGSPALSAAQCGVAVHDATDAAKNAAAIILTSEGLSAVYSAVVESRRIFRKLKSYVTYRFAASIQIVVVLTILIFASNCSIQPLYIILLALFNDITML